MCSASLLDIGLKFRNFVQLRILNAVEKNVFYAKLNDSWISFLAYIYFENGFRC